MQGNFWKVGDDDGFCVAASYFAQTEVPSTTDLLTATAHSRGTDLLTSTAHSRARPFLICNRQRMRIQLNRARIVIRRSVFYTIRQPSGALEAIQEDLDFKYFLGEHSPRPP